MLANMVRKGCFALEQICNRISFKILENSEFLQTE